MNGGRCLFPSADGSVNRTNTTFVGGVSRCLVDSTPEEWSKINFFNSDPRVTGWLVNNQSLTFTTSFGLGAKVFNECCTAGVWDCGRKCLDFKTADPPTTCPTSSPSEATPCHGVTPTGDSPKITGHSGDPGQPKPSTLPTG